MIALAKAAPKTNRRPKWHARFLCMMPAITKYARYAFRHLDAESRDEALQEVVVSAMLAHVRLCQQQKADLDYPSALARPFATRSHRSIANRTRRVTVVIRRWIGKQWLSDFCYVEEIGCCR